MTDTTTGQPLPDVTVAIGNAHAVTSGTGAFRLTNVKPGTATMNVHSDDVPPQQFTIKVGAATTHADIKACSATLDYHCGGL